MNIEMKIYLNIQMNFQMNIYNGQLNDYPYGNSNHLYEQLGKH